MQLPSDFTGNRYAAIRDHVLAQPQAEDPWWERTDISEVTELVHVACRDCAYSYVMAASHKTDGHCSDFCQGAEARRRDWRSRLTYQYEAYAILSGVA